MVDGTKIKFLLEHRWIPETRSCVTIPRQVHHGGNKPVEPVRAGTGGSCGVLQAHDAERIGQIISGSAAAPGVVILQGTQKRLVRVRTGVVAEAAAHHRDTLTHQRSLNSGQCVRLAVNRSR